MPVLFLAGLDNLAVLASHNLNFGGGHHFVRFHLEGGILHDESPHVVAEAICVEVTLE